MKNPNLTIEVLFEKDASLLFEDEFKRTSVYSCKGRYISPMLGDSEFNGVTTAYQKFVLRMAHLRLKHKQQILD